MIQSEQSNWRQVVRRGFKFYTVGTVGTGVQLTTLGILAGFLRLNYLIATALAVETALLHNFVWHERWTWKDHTHANPSGTLGRLLRFNLSNGTLSIVGNVVLMRVFVGIVHLHFFLSNLLSIGSCSLLNFLISHRYIFHRHHHTEAKGESTHEAGQLEVQN